MTYPNDTECLFDIQLDGKRGLIDKTGKVIVIPQFDFISDFYEGMAVVGLKTEQTTKYGYVGTSGDIIPPQFDSAYQFSEGMGFVWILGKWGCIDRRGKFVISPRFDDCDCEFGFGEGLMAVSQLGKWGYIDKTGTFVIAPQFDHAHNFCQGWARVVKGDEETGKVGLIDKKGEIVVPRVRLDKWL